MKSIPTFKFLTLAAFAVLSFVSALPADLYAAEGGGMPQLDPASFKSQIFWLAISFAVMFLLMWKVALPRVGEVIEQRQQKVTADLERAEALRADVEEIMGAYEELLAKARNDAQAELSKAQDKIKADQDKKLAKHDDEISARISEAEERIADARKEAMAEISAVAGEAASAAVAKLTGKAPTKTVVTKAVNAAAKEA